MVNWNYIILYLQTTDYFLKMRITNPCKNCIVKAKCDDRCSLKSEHLNTWWNIIPGILMLGGVISTYGIFFTFII